MSEADTTMDEIMKAVTKLQSGDRIGGRSDMLALWEKHRSDGSAMQRCTLAHFLADTEDDVEEELRWDKLALQAATGHDDDRDRDPVDESFAGFLPSLHLNVGDAYRRMGCSDLAAAHAANGMARIGSLPQGGYGNVIRTGLTKLLMRLDGEDAARSSS